MVCPQQDCWPCSEQRVEQGGADSPRWHAWWRWWWRSWETWASCHHWGSRRGGRTWRGGTRAARGSCWPPHLWASGLWTAPPWGGGGFDAGTWRTLNWSSYPGWCSEWAGARPPSCTPACPGSPWGWWESTSAWLRDPNGSLDFEKQSFASLVSPLHLSVTPQSSWSDSGASWSVCSSGQAALQGPVKIDPLLEESDRCVRLVKADIVCLMTQPVSCPIYFYFFLCSSTTTRGNRVVEVGQKQTSRESVITDGMVKRKWGKVEKNLLPLVEKVSK